MKRQRSVLIFFLDGVGLGEDNPETNPFATAALPHLTHLLGEKWYVRGRGRITTPKASLVPTDTTLGVPGTPQSATGQAAILTGRNIPQQIGEHYGPKPNPAVTHCIQEGSLFAECTARGLSAALLTPYPHSYFNALDSGRRLPSTVPLAATQGGVPLLTVEDLHHGRAISPNFTNKQWHTYLGYTDLPLLTLDEAGQRLAQLATKHHFSFFEHWPSDRLGHREPLHAAVQHLEMLDHVIGSLLTHLDYMNCLLLLTSDHGNIEDKSHRKHTQNPVPTMLFGHQHTRYAEQIHDLTDIATVVRQFLDLT